MHLIGYWRSHIILIVTLICKINNISSIFLSELFLAISDIYLKGKMVEIQILLQKLLQIDDVKNDYR